MVATHVPSNEKNKSNTCLSICHSFDKFKSTFQVLSIISIILLAFVYQFVLTVQILDNSLLKVIVQILSVVLILVTGLPLFFKGLVPLCTSILGLSLIYAGIVLPLSSFFIGESHFKTVMIPVTEQSINMASHSYFLLGIFMLLLSTIVAYRPALLYTKNRPSSTESIWKDYPVWDGDDNKIKIVSGRYDNAAIPIMRLITDKERYILWRYEYILADIYGRPHLVKTNAFVPPNSVIFRDSKTGKIMGKPKYTGYFI